MLTNIRSDYSPSDEYSPPENADFDYFVRKQLTPEVTRFGRGKSGRLGCPITRPRFRPGLLYLPIWHTVPQTHAYSELEVSNNSTICDNRHEYRFRKKTTRNWAFQTGSPEPSCTWPRIGSFLTRVLQRCRRTDFNGPLVLDIAKNTKHVSHTCCGRPQSSS